jgi:putative hydrolase of the HAD superfamily
MICKAVFFDFDGVLTLDRTGSLTTNRYLNQTTGIPLERIDAAIRAR